MSQKRQPEDKKVGSEGNSPEEKRQRVPALKNVILEAMKMNAIQNLFSALEPLIRRVVKEEIEVAFGKHLTSMKKNRENQIDPSKSKTLQLQFINKLSLPVFTGTRIDGEESSVLKVALFDTLTGKIVNSDPESLAKVEIVVLEGDFDGCEEDNWTLEEFNSNIVKEREGKRPLLVGNAFLDLNEGIGDMGDLIFTDNSSWTRSRKFRLGARVVGGNFDGIRVREAKTEAFMVKDHRGELYKKHYPPSLLDEVWRLEKIGKDGAFHKRLSRENINTVKDFLTLLHMNSARLRTILGQGMSTKIWEGTVDHAKTCPLSNQMYVYYPPNTQPRTGIVFNIVRQVLGLLGEQQFFSIEELSETDKVDAQKLVKVAYEHWEDVVPYEDGAILRGSLNLPTICFPSSPPEVESSYTIKLPSSQGSSGLCFTHPCSSTPDIPSSILSIEDTGDIQNYALQGIDNMDLGYDHPLRTPVFNTSIYGSDSMAKTMCGDDHLQYFDHETTLQSQNFSLDSLADLGSAISGFFASRSATAIAIHKAKTRWTMIFCVVRWRLIKRIVALKKSGMLEMDRYSSV